MKTRFTRNPLLAWRRALEGADRVEELEQKIATLEKRLQQKDETATAASAAVVSVRQDVMAMFEDRLGAIRDHLRGLQEANEKLHGAVASANLQFDGARNHLDGLQAEAERLMEHRTVTEHRFAAVERHLAGLQEAVDGFEGGASGEGRASAVANLEDRVRELREEIVPAAVRRADAVIDRLAGEIDELGSLVERMILREPLPVPVGSSADLATALADVQPHLVDAFRGAESEIAHRLERYLEVLRGAAPVLDLGAGRGELLLMLRDEGVEALGVEADPALAQAAHRRGLKLVEGDVLEVLRRQADDSFGAVTAMHLMEHLPAADLLATLAEIRRVLRPGGELIIECPNPGSLRVGASLLWLDPTHEKPLPAETLQLFLRSNGFEVVDLEFLHPFPDDQRFHRQDGPESEQVDPGQAPLIKRLDELERRLDDVLNGMRDFSIRARKPETESVAPADGA